MSGDSNNNNGGSNGENKNKKDSNNNNNGENKNKKDSNNNNNGGSNGENKNKKDSNGENKNKKVEEPQPHSVKEQLPGVDYCVNSPPPWPEAIVLGFQQYLLSLGVTVLIPSLLVPQMGGGYVEKARVIQTLLFVSGINTYLQSWFGTRLPVVAVGSYSFMIPVTSIVQSNRYRRYTDPYERFVRTMRGIQGAIIIAGCFQILVCFLGFWRNVVRLFSPLSIAPFLTFAGLGLYHLGFPMLANCLEVGLPGLILLVFVTQYLPGLINSKQIMCPKRIFDRYGILMVIPVVWLYAELLTLTGVYNNKPQITQTSCRTDRAGIITASPWIYLPYPFQWGNPTFDVGEAFAMMAASIATLFESTSIFYAAARYGSASPIPPSIISRGTGWLGVGVLMNGIFGGVTGLTTSVENAGLLALTKVGSRRVIQISAAFMIFFSIFGKFGAFFASIPLPIFAATYCVLFAYISSAGLSFLQFCNLNSFKNKFILGFSFFMGISIPQYFREYYHGGGRFGHSSNWFDDIIRVVFMSHTTVAGIVALILDCTISRDNDETKRDCGLKWWEKFGLYNLDVRNSEFYGLPLSLDKFFPSL